MPVDRRRSGLAEVQLPVTTFRLPQGGPRRSRLASSGPSGFEANGFFSDEQSLTCYQTEAEPHSVVFCFVFNSPLG